MYVHTQDLGANEVNNLLTIVVFIMQQSSCLIYAKFTAFQNLLFIWEKSPPPFRTAYSSYIASISIHVHISIVFRVFPPFGGLNCISVTLLRFWKTLRKATRTTATCGRLWRRRRSSARRWTRVCARRRTRTAWSGSKHTYSVRVCLRYVRPKTWSLLVTVKSCQTYSVCILAQREEWDTY